MRFAITILSLALILPGTSRADKPWTPDIPRLASLQRVTFEACSEKGIYDRMGLTLGGVTAAKINQAQNEGRCEKVLSRYAELAASKLREGYRFVVEPGPISGTHADCSPLDASWGSCEYVIACGSEDFDCLAKLIQVRRLGNDKQVELSESQARQLLTALENARGKDVTVRYFASQSKTKDERGDCEADGGPCHTVTYDLKKALLFFQ